MRHTIDHFRQRHNAAQPIVVLTAYDATSARVAEAAAVDAILVGDTLGMVVQGHDSTISVTLDHMVYHTAIVARTSRTPLIIADLPFMSYSITPEQAMQSATRLMQEGSAGCVKLEGGQSMAATIERIVHAGIPVMAHIGLTPQSVHQFGGFRVQGREVDAARHIVRDALAVQQAGAFSVVLELIPRQLAAFITGLLDIPTIGIGAGGGCSGQVQVFHDILSLFDGFVPRHTHQYASIGQQMIDATRQYAGDVTERSFPRDEHSFSMSAELIHRLEQEFGDQNAGS